MNQYYPVYLTPGSILPFGYNLTSFISGEIYVNKQLDTFMTTSKELKLGIPLFIDNYIFTLQPNGQVDIKTFMPTSTSSPSRKRTFSSDIILPNKKIESVPF